MRVLHVGLALGQGSLFNETRKIRLVAPAVLYLAAIISGSGPDCVPK